MALPKAELQALLQTAFPEGEIEITSLIDDDDHYQVIIKSVRFAGLNRVKQHQLVYKALNGKMGNELHAMALQTIAIEN